MLAKAPDVAEVILFSPKKRQNALDLPPCFAVARRITNPLALGYVFSSFCLVAVPPEGLVP